MLIIAGKLHKSGEFINHRGGALLDAHSPILWGSFICMLTQPANNPCKNVCSWRYTEQTLPSPQQEHRRLLESQMETLIKGLPEQTKMQARINFYSSRVEEKLRQVQKPEPPGQSEISFER